MKTFFAFACGYFLAGGLNRQDWSDLAMALIFGVWCFSLSFYKEEIK